MGQRSKVLDLPDHIRTDLDSRLIKGSFGGYVELEAWLTVQGYEIGKSSLHRYGSKLEERIGQLKRSTDQARALVKASPDDSGDVSEAMMRLMQEKLFTLLMDIEVDPETADLGKIAKAMAPLVRAQIALKKFASEVQQKTDAVFSAMASAQGMSAEQASFWREKFLGVAKT